MGCDNGWHPYIMGCDKVTMDGSRYCGMCKWMGFIHVLPSVATELSQKQVGLTSFHEAWCMHCYFLHALSHEDSTVATPGGRVASCVPAFCAAGLFHQFVCNTVADTAG